MKMHCLPSVWRCFIGFTSKKMQFVGKAVLLQKVMEKYTFFSLFFEIWLHLCSHPAAYLRAACCFCVAPTWTSLFSCCRTCHIDHQLKKKKNKVCECILSLLKPEVNLVQHCPQLARTSVLVPEPMISLFQVICALCRTIACLCNCGLLAFVLLMGCCFFVHVCCRYLASCRESRNQKHCSTHYSKPSVTLRGTHRNRWWAAYSFVSYVSPVPASCVWILISALASLHIFK